MSHRCRSAWCCFCGGASSSSEEGPTNSDDGANEPASPPEAPILPVPGEPASPPEAPVLPVLGEPADRPEANPPEAPILPVDPNVESEGQATVSASSELGSDGNGDNAGTDLPSQDDGNQEETDNPLDAIEEGLLPTDEDLGTSDWGDPVPEIQARDPSNPTDEDLGTNEWGDPVPEVPARDPAMPPDWLREQGFKVLRWIENSGEPACPIPQQTLTFQQVDQDTDVWVDENQEFPLDLQMLPEIPETAPDERRFTRFSATHRRGMWVGMTAPGVIIMQNIARDQAEATDEPPGTEPPNAHSSEIALAFYLRDHPIESLQNVFVTIIMNSQTRDYLEKHLYSDFLSRDEKDWNSYSSVHECPMHIQAWEHGSEEFEALMGTRIGRTVAYLVLGGFPRGTRRIARIFVYITNVWYYRFDFRFDIEPISSPASTQ